MKRQIFPGISVARGVRFGKPVVDGTRVPVDMVVGKIAGGMTIRQVMEEYDLNKDQVHGALRYAASVVAQEDVLFA